MSTGPLEPVEVVYRSNYSGMPDPTRLVIRDDEAWRFLWERLARANRHAGPMPEIDFTRDLLLLAAAGQGSSGSPGLHFEGVARESGSVRAHLHVEFPGRGCSSAADATTLVIVVRIPRTELPVYYLEHPVARECR